MPAKQKAPGVFTFAGKCYSSTLFTKREGYCLQAFRGNVVVRQQALSILPRISQRKKKKSLPRNFAGFGIAPPEPGLWPDTWYHCPPTEEKLLFWSCISYYLFPTDHNCPVVWWKGCCVLKEHLMFWDILAVKSGLPPAPIGSRYF